jgi:hypothetical protein
MDKYLDKSKNMFLEIKMYFCMEVKRNDSI